MVYGAKFQNMHFMILGKVATYYKNNEPRHDILLTYASNKGADQVFRCLASIILLVSISESSSLYQASVAAQAGLSLACLQSPKTGFLVTKLI